MTTQQQSVAEGDRGAIPPRPGAHATNRTQMTLAGAIVGGGLLAGFYMLTSAPKASGEGAQGNNCPSCGQPSAGAAGGTSASPDATPVADHHASQTARAATWIPLLKRPIARPYWHFQ